MTGMKRLKVWKVTALFAALLVLPLYTPAAQASGFSLGALFRIGGVHFNLTFGDFGYGHPRGYYYRTADPISYDGYRCNSYCFNSGGYHYHSDSCPLLRHHLAYYDIDPLSLYDRFAPSYGAGYGYDDYNSYNNYGGYGSYGGGYYRYDNRYDNRYNGRYDNYPYRDRDYGRHDRNDRDYGRHDRNDRDYGRHDRNDRNNRNDGRHDRNDRNDRNDGRHDRHDGEHHEGGGHHGGHSSGRPHN